MIYLIHTHAGSSDVDVMVAAHDVGIGTLLDQRHFLVGKMSDKLFSVKFKKHMEYRIGSVLLTVNR